MSLTCCRQTPVIRKGDWRFVWALLFRAFLLRLFAGNGLETQRYRDSMRLPAITFRATTQHRIDEILSEVVFSCPVRNRLSLLEEGCLGPLERLLSNVLSHIDKTNRFRAKCQYLVYF